MKRDTDTGRAAALTSAATPIVVPEVGPTPVGGVTRAGGTSRPLTTSVTPATGTAPAIALEPTPRKPMWLLAVAAFAVIILAVLGWWFFRARGTHPRATVGHKSVAVPTSRRINRSTGWNCSTAETTFSSLQARDADSAILNLEQGERVNGWGRLIFHVADADALWRRFNELGFEPEKPQNASWGERYFHLLDPDGHELSFARPLK